MPRSEPAVVARRWSQEARRELAELPRTDTASVRAVRRRYSTALNSESAPIVLRFARELAAARDWPSRVVGWETLASHEGAMRLLDDEVAEEMAEGLADWASIDLYGVTVLGQAWREGTVTDAKILTWSRSADRWRRRLALVATVPLNARARGGSGDVTRTLRLCRALRDDRDDMVVKGMSWALRELSKRHRSAVQAFMSKEKDRLAPRVRREVMNKLQTGLKSGRRNS
jgi:3-methyladenine DNA glycosylase AlkD